MKRSRSISLLLMGSLALGSAGCGSENAEDFSAFTSVNECVVSGLFTEAECREFAQTAQAQTPRFNSKEDCEAKFGAGACEGAAPGDALMADGSTAASTSAQADSSTNSTSVRRSSGSMWMPMMMGFMAGRYMGSNGPMQGSQGLYRDPAQQPGQNSGARSFRTATGDSVSTDSTGRVSNPSSKLKQSISHNAKPSMSRSGTGTRGGFSGGGVSGGMGGGGS